MNGRFPVTCDAVTPLTAAFGVVEALAPSTPELGAAEAVVPAVPLDGVVVGVVAGVWVDVVGAAGVTAAVVTAAVPAVLVDEPDEPVSVPWPVVVLVGVKQSSVP